MRLFLLSVAALVAASTTCWSSGLTLANLEPAKGDKTVYRVSETSTITFEGAPAKATSTGAGTQTSEVVAVSKPKGATVYAELTTQTMKRTRTPGGSEDSSSYILEVCRAVPFGLFVDANISVEDGEDSSIDVGKSLLEVKFPCEPGATWRVGRLGFKEGFSLRPVSKAESIETVSVPAGTFANCVKVVSTCPAGIEGYLMQEGQKLEIVSGEASFTSWYAPLIGVVKEFSNTSLRLRPEGQDQAAVLKMDTTTQTELTEYKLGQRGKK